MSDRIAVMNPAASSRSATPEIYDRPASTFVAGFIGVSNLMPGKVDGTGEQRRDPARQRGHGRHRVTGFRSASAAAVVRPEKLGSIDGRTPRVPSIDGLVESSLYLGTSTQLLVRLPG